MQKFYTNIVCTSLHTDAVKRAWAFANKVTTTTDYSDSNQSAVNKIKDDHFVSKLGEEAAKIVLSNFSEVKGPDYSIYEGGLKSWADDLFVRDTGIAVKTQRRTNANKYGLSWTFQAGGLRYDPILNKPDAWIIFVEYDDKHPYQCYVYPPFQMKELILGEPKIHRLKGSKKVVYANTLLLQS